MLRAVAVSSLIALTAGVALAQPPGDPNSYPAPSPAQPAYPSAGAGGGKGQGGGAGDDAPGYGQGQGGYGQDGGGRWGADPETRALRQRMRAACTTDLSTYCNGAGQGGRGALHECMSANQARFSPPCQAAIADLHAHMRDRRTGAAPDPGQPDMSPPPAGPTSPQ